MPASGHWEVEAGSSRVFDERHRARLASLHAGAGARRDIERGNLEDGAERVEGDRHRERSMHASLDQAKYLLLGRVEPWVGVKDI